MRAADFIDRETQERLVVMNQRDERTERMLKWFEHSHLPGPLGEVSQVFQAVAAKIASEIEPGPERTVALRKLLEAKDAAVRAKLHPGG